MTPELFALFDGRTKELALCVAALERLFERYPGAVARVLRTQVALDHPRPFCYLWSPLRRRKDWPEHILLITFGLRRRIEDPRIAQVVTPYPNRWTHHVLLEKIEDLDDQVLDWLDEALAVKRLIRRPV